MGDKPFLHRQRPDKDRISLFALKKQDLARSKVDAFDFKGAEKLTADQLRYLHRIFLQFLEHFAGMVAPILQMRVHLDLEEINLIPFKDYVDSVPNPTIIALFKLDPLTKGLVVMDLSIAFAIVDRLMGGKGAPLEQHREFTEIERPVFQKHILSRIFEAYTETWKDKAALSLQLENLEFDPLNVIIVPTSENMTVVTFKLKVGRVEGGMELAIPVRHIRPLIPKSTLEDYAARGSQTAAPQQKETSFPSFVKKVEVARIPIHVELGRAEIPFQDLLNIEPGDYIRLNTLVAENLRIRIAGKTKFVGKPGVRGAKMAVQITAVIPEGDDTYED
ncbi:MAG: FliM/FliN family flagellar motor switch protein [Armatimonadetes bacterium]|nr:FliM/FliN family flagellar motor switch protein [Armatimonadota bacterium]